MTDKHIGMFGKRRCIYLNPLRGPPHKRYIDMMRFKLFYYAAAVGDGCFKDDFRVQTAKCLQEMRTEVA